jgi:hypothetical protein
VRSHAGRQPAAKIQSYRGFFGAFCKAGLNLLFIMVRAARGETYAAGSRRSFYYLVHSWTEITIMPGAGRSVFGLCVAGKLLVYCTRRWFFGVG